MKNASRWILAASAAVLGVSVWLTIVWRKSFAAGLGWGVFLVLSAVWFFFLTLQARASTFSAHPVRDYIVGALLRIGFSIGVFLALVFFIKVHTFGLLAGITAGLSVLTAFVLVQAIRQSAIVNGNKGNT